MSEYEKTKERLVDIAKILSEYPDNLKEQVFNVLIKSADIKNGESKSDSDKRIVTLKSKNKRRNTIKGKIVEDKRLITKEQEFKAFLNSRDVRTDVNFIVASIYYMRNVLKIEEVDKDYVMTCYKLLSRKIGNIDSTINNCINRNQYLSRDTKGYYILTAFGDNLASVKMIKSN